MKRGEVYRADLFPRSGSEQQGRRPVIVISHDAFNQTQGWRSISSFRFPPLLHKLGGVRVPCWIRRGVAGLTRESVALCHQVTTLDRAKLVQRIGELSATELS